MARVNVYLPEALAQAARDAGLNVSSLTQQALVDELGRRATSAWLATLEPGESAVTAADVREALDAAREELGG